MFVRNCCVAALRLLTHQQPRSLFKAVAITIVALTTILSNLSVTALAIVLTHNNSTMVVADDFESPAVGSAWDNGVRPGDWQSSTTPLTNEISATQPPGPFEGAHYGSLIRTGSQQGIRSKFTPIGTGRVDLDTMVYIPDGMQWLSIVLGNSVGFNPTSPSPFIHSYVIFHLNSTHEVHDYAIDEVPMNFAYKNGEWMHLKIGYDFGNAASGYTVDLTTTDGTFNYTRAITNAEMPIDTFMIKFEANGNSAFFDAPYTLPPAGILGDFDANGTVEAADYVLWRKNDGTSNALQNDNGLGTPIGQSHYDLWRANYGASLSSSGLAAESAVPEPGTAVLSIIALLFLTKSSRQRARRTSSNACSEEVPVKP